MKNWIASSRVSVVDSGRANKCNCERGGRNFRGGGNCIKALMPDYHI
jgi:hypothetical protein